mmetsp:Transcript_56890/g.180007  ORF Transcript_56890/g.180007 Transcript_56890/m.180007 type:complete len:265 (-) Transcript_56890:340-1134(-)
MRGGQVSYRDCCGDPSREELPVSVHVECVGGPVAVPVPALEHPRRRPGGAVHKRQEGSHPQPCMRGGDDVQHGGLQRPPLRRGRQGARADPGARVGTDAHGRSARGARAHVPQGHLHYQVACEAWPHRHPGPRGREDHGPQLPDRAKAIRGQLAGPVKRRAHRKRAVRGGVVPHDARILSRISQGRELHEEAGHLRDEPQQVHGLPVPHKLPRARARRQDHRLQRQHLRAPGVCDGAAPAIHLRADLTPGAHAHPLRLQALPPG